VPHYSKADDERPQFARSGRLVPLRTTYSRNGSQVHGRSKARRSAPAGAQRFQGRKRVHNADDLMSAIVSKRLVEHLERSGFVVMKKPPIEGGAALGADSRDDYAVR